MLVKKKRNRERNLTELSCFVENSVISTPAWLILFMVYDKDKVKVTGSVVRVPTTSANENPEVTLLNKRHWRKMWSRPRRKTNWKDKQSPGKT